MTFPKNQWVYSSDVKTRGSALPVDVVVEALSRLRICLCFLESLICNLGLDSQNLDQQPKSQDPETQHPWHHHCFQLEVTDDMGCCTLAIQNNDGSLHIMTTDSQFL